MDNVSLIITDFDNRKLYQNVQDACSNIKIRSSFSQITTECSFTLSYQNVNTFKFKFDIGDSVDLYYRRGLVFSGKIIDIDDTNSNEMKITAYDYSWWLCKSNITKNFKEMSVRDALIYIYSICGVNYMIDKELGDNGNIMIDEHLVKQKPASKVLSAIYSDITKKTGLYYYIHQRPEDGCVIITEADKYYSGMTIQQSSQNVIDGNLISYSINKSMTNLVTEVRLFDDKGRELSVTGNSNINYEDSDEDIEEDDEEIEDKGTVDQYGNVVNVIKANIGQDGRYGTIIENVIANKGEKMSDITDRANKIISDKGKIKEELTVECIGDINYQVAMGVMVKIPNTEYYDRFMYIVESEWNFNADSTFIAKLTLSPSKHHDLTTWADIEEKIQQDEEDADNTSKTGSDLWNRIEAELKKHLGVPYVWGGKAPPGMDCSGYVAYVYNQFKNELEITSANGELTSYTIAMMNEGKDVTKDFPNNLVKGDIIFPHSGHVVAYIGDNQVIHEPKTGDVCKISNIYFSSVAKVIRVIPDSAWVVEESGDGEYHGENIVTLDQLKQLGWKPSEYHLQDLNKCLVKNSINTPARLQHFMSQCAHECGCGQFAMELGNGSASVSGGSKYKGAGAIQLTHDYNYRDFAKYVGDDRVYSEGCSYVAKNYFWSAAGWWWSNNNMNKLCDGGATVEQITKRVNGGYNGLAERKKYYNKCKEIFK